MVPSEMLSQTATFGVGEHRDLGDEVLFAKHLVHQHPEMVDFIVVDAHENHAIVTKELPGQKETRVHGTQPARMNPPSMSRPFQLPARVCRLRLQLPNLGEVRLEWLSVVIAINEIVPSVVWRIDIDELHASRVRPVQELEDLKVLALDEEVLSTLERDRLLR